MNIREYVKQSFIIAALLITTGGSVGAVNLKENSAAVQQIFSVPPMSINISSTAPGGCPAGQNWDVVLGQCTPALVLRTEPVTQACGCTCPDQGSCTAQRSGTYKVSGWRTPPSGAEFISGSSPVTWGACTETSNSCYATDVKPVFSSFTSTAMHTNDGTSLNSPPLLSWSGENLLPTTTYSLQVSIPDYAWSYGTFMPTPSPGSTSWWIHTRQQKKLWPEGPPPLVVDNPFTAILTACNGSSCTVIKTTVPVNINQPNGS